MVGMGMGLGWVVCIASWWEGLVWALERWMDGWMVVGWLYGITTCNNNINDINNMKKGFY